MLIECSVVLAFSGGGSGLVSLVSLVSVVFFSSVMTRDGNRYLKAESLFDQNDRGPAPSFAVEDQQFVDCAWDVEDFHQSFAFQRQAVSFDSLERFVEVFHDLLRPHNPDDLARSAH